MIAQMLASFLPEGVTIEQLTDQFKKAAVMFEQHCRDVQEIKETQKLILNRLGVNDNERIRNDTNTTTGSDTNTTTGSAKSGGGSDDGN